MHLRAKKGSRNVFYILCPDTHQENPRRPNRQLNPAHAKGQKDTINVCAEIPVNQFSTVQAWLI